jgi:acetylornithine deacetylase/succinyl-diaminopimelate desuccinylase-like protein
VEQLALSNYLEANKGRALANLLEWLRVPSISAEPAHAADVRASAELCASYLRSAGLEGVEVIETGTDGAPGAPAVYAEWLRAGPGVPTVLLYGHHDVQPVDPLEQWSSPPFEPVVSDGQVFARGASDDKGQVLMQIEAARGLLTSRGALPVNLKLLIEGEEESGSPHFERLLWEQRERFSADVVVCSDSTMRSPELPTTTVGWRGLVAFDIELRTAPVDLHSGIWGGTAPNAALYAARVAAALHDEHWRVAVPGFYDDVRELSTNERASLLALALEEEEYRREAGVSFLVGEEGRTPQERTSTRPTAEVVGIHAGYGGPGMKTIVPATANLKVALRLVPDQKPEKIAQAFQRWLDARLPPGVERTIKRHGGVSPMVTPIDHPALQVLSGAMEKVWGKKPLFERSGGSGPEEALARVLEAPVISLGIALPGDHFHAPNETLSLSQLWRGILAAGELLIGLGSLGRTIS